MNYLVIFLLRILIAWNHHLVISIAMNRDLAISIPWNMIALDCDLAFSLIMNRDCHEP